MLEDTKDTATDTVKHLNVFNPPVNENPELIEETKPTETKDSFFSYIGNILKYITIVAVTIVITAVYYVYSISKPVYVGEFTKTEAWEFVNKIYLQVPCIIIGGEGASFSVYVNTHYACNYSLSNFMDVKGYETLKVVTRAKDDRTTVSLYSNTHNLPNIQLDEVNAEGEISDE